VGAGAGSHLPVPWQLESSAQLDEAFSRSLTLSVGPDGSDFASWTCPRCAERYAQAVERESTYAGLSASPRSGELRIRCDCGQSHADRPEGEVGCGYRIVVELGEEAE
jgi:hypothetical protein